MKCNSEPMSEALNAELAALEAMPEDTIDTSDIAPVSDWSGARRGVLYRSVRQQLLLRLDADVVVWFKDAGDGYQTRINHALREYVERHSKRA